jgi:hypothetical protein
LHNRREVLLPVTYRYHIAQINSSVSDCQQLEKGVAAMAVKVTARRNVCT